MRIKTELSEQPPVYRVAHDGEEAVIRFYTDVETEEYEGATVYRATVCDLRRPWADNLESRIAANVSLWRELANAEADKQEQAAELARMTAEYEKLDKLAAQIAFVALAENGTIDGVTAGEHHNLFAEWQTGVAYDAGKIVAHGGKLYRCVQPHTSQDDWTPAAVPALWTGIADPAEEWPEWSQPIGAHDAYNLGDKVSHGGKHWESTADGNVWEPGIVVYWTEVT